MPGIIEYLKVESIHIVQSTHAGAVQGIATDDSYLYLVREDSDRVDVFKTSNMTKTGYITIGVMEHPRGLVACPHYGCLYIAECMYADDYSIRHSTYIHRIELSDRSSKGWGAIGKPGGISLTRSHNLLLTLDFSVENTHGLNQIHEYTTHGELMRKISLDASIDYPVQSIELSTGQFVVCHHGDSLHRVCIVDLDGQIMRSYGSAGGSTNGRLNWPCWVIVNKNDDILIADTKNNRIQIISTSLNYIGDVTVPGYRLFEPYRLHIDELKSRLYISENF